VVEGFVWLCVGWGGMRVGMGEDGMRMGFWFGFWIYPLHCVSAGEEPRAFFQCQIYIAPVVHR